MDAKAIRELSDEELDAKLKQTVESLFNLRFQKATGQLENPRRIQQVKRDVARMKTIKEERNAN